MPPPAWTFGSLHRASGKDGVLPKFGKSWAEANAAGWGDKATFALVSNAPVSDDVTRALEIIVRGEPETTNSRKLLTFTDLREHEAGECLRRVDFDCDHGGRLFHEIRLLERLSGHFPKDTSSASDKIMRLVIRHAGLEGEKLGPINRSQLLGWLGVSERDLFPCESRMTYPSKAIPTAYPRALQAMFTESTSWITVHADQGMGKSTTLQSLESLLPSGSVVLIYDCYGGGDLSQVNRRRRAQTSNFITQITNELALRGLGPLRLARREGDHLLELSDFEAVLKYAAAQILALGGKLVIAAEAVDDALATTAGQTWFLTDLIGISWPLGCHFVASTRTHRLQELPAKCQTNTLKIEGFDLAQSSAHLRQTWPEASDSECLEFHTRTGASNSNKFAAPRVQKYAIEQPGTTSAALAVENSKGGWDTLMDALLRDFKGHFPDEEIGQAIAVTDLLIPLASSRHFAWLWNVSESVAQAKLHALGPGIVFSGDSIHFRDRDFEEHFRRLPQPDDKAGAHRQIALCFQSHRMADAICAEYVAAHLHAANEFEPLIQLALREPELPAELLLNPRERSELSLRRVDFALQAAASSRRWEDLVELGMVREELGRTRTGLQNLFREAPLLAAKYHGHEAVGEELLSTERQNGSATKLWEYSLVLASCGKMEEAKTYLKRGADAEQIRERMSDHDYLRPRDLIANVKSRYLIFGLDQLIERMSQWNSPWPEMLIEQLRSGLAGMLSPAERDEILCHEKIPLRFRALVAASLWLEVGYANHQALLEIIPWLSARHYGAAARRQQHREPDWFDAIALCEAAAFVGIDFEAIAPCLRRHLPPAPDRLPDDGMSIKYGRWESALRGRAVLAYLQGKKLSVDELKTELADQQQQQGYRSDSALRSATDFANTRAQMLEVKNATSANSIAVPWLSKLCSYEGRSISEWEEFDQTRRCCLNWIRHLSALKDSDSILLERFLDAVLLLKVEGEDGLLWLQNTMSICRDLGFRSEYHNVVNLFLRQCIRTAVTTPCDPRTKRDLLIAIANATHDEDLRTEAWETAVKYVGHCGLHDWHQFDELLGLAKKVGNVRPSSARSLAVDLAHFAKRFRLVTDARDFSSEKTFGAVASLHFPTALVMMARWMDNAQIEAHEGLEQIVAVGATQRVLSAADGYCLLHLAMPNLTNEQLLCDLLEAAPKGNEDERSSKQVLLQKMVQFVERDMPQSGRQKAAQRLLGTAEACGFGALSCVDRLRKLLAFLATRKLSKEDRLTHFTTEGAVESMGTVVPPEDCSKVTNWLALSNEFRYPRSLSGFFEAWALSAPRSVCQALAMDILKHWQHDKNESGILTMIKCLLPRIPQAALATESTLVLEFAAYFLGEVGSQSYRRTVEEIAQLAKLIGASEAEFLADVVGIRAIGEVYWIPGLAVGAAIAGLADFDQLVGRIQSRLNWISHRWFPENTGDDWIPFTQEGIPDDLLDSVTGFYWFCFSHPDKNVRCRAMYASLEASKLWPNGVAIVGRLVEYTKSTDTGVYRDPAQGPCFWISGRVTLWRVLRRIARESPELLSTHIDTLTSVVLDKATPHVLIRELGRSALLDLHKAGIQFPEEALVRLKKLNRPVSVEKKEKASSRFRRESEREARDGGRTRFRFDDTDTIPYWYNRLIGVFGASHSRFLEAADRWVCDAWRIPTFETWKDEPRRAHIQGDNYRRWSNDHGQDPEIETLRIYAEFHAMFCVAGEWLDEGATIIKEHSWRETDCEFLYWLNRWIGHDDSLTWGRDLVTPAPHSALSWGDLPSQTEAVTALELADFESALRFENWEKDWIPIEIEERAYDRSLEHSISTVVNLVDERLASSFVSALQTRAWHLGRWMPSMDDSEEVDGCGEFTWESLVVSEHRDALWLEHDPFLQREHASVYNLSDKVTKSLGASSLSRECWTAEGHGKFAHFQKCNVNGWRGESGHGGQMFWFRASTLLTILRKENKAAIFRVTIKRDEKKAPNFSNPKAENPERDCALYFLLRADTTLVSMAGSRHLGEPMAGQPWPY